MYAMLSFSEHMFRNEVDRVIGSIDRRLAEQRKVISALKAAHKPVKSAQAKLYQLDRCRSRLQSLVGQFAPDRRSRNHRQ
jgi:hypothetical protein